MNHKLIAACSVLTVAGLYAPAAAAGPDAGTLRVVDEPGAGLLVSAPAYSNFWNTAEWSMAFLPACGAVPAAVAMTNGPSTNLVPFATLLSGGDPPAVSVPLPLPVGPTDFLPNAVPILGTCQNTGGTSTIPRWQITGGTDTASMRVGLHSFFSIYSVSEAALDPTLTTVHAPNPSCTREAG